jgi:hypothetical protein
MSKLLIENAPEGGIKSAVDGSYPVVLITPGQGSSGYYREQVIADYAPAAFPRGTHVYLDHLKEGETRTPAKLLGTLIEDTTVNESGEAVNRFLPLSKHAQWIEEVHKHVGMSVAVRGEGRKGEIDGRQTLIVESLEPHITNTVDVVSYAGRGGRFLESFLEEANAAEGIEPNSSTVDGLTEGNDTTMAITEEQFAALVESVNGLVAKIAVIEGAVVPQVDENQNDRAAVVAAVKAVESADISDATKARLTEGIAAGNLDVAPVIEAEVALREEIRGELEAKQLEEAGASTNSGGQSTTDFIPKGW